MLRFRKAPLRWRNLRYFLGVQAIGILTCGSVSAQVWNENPDGVWGKAENWLGPVPGNIAEPGFIAGDLVFFSGPSLKGDEKVQVDLDGEYSVGAIFIQADSGVRLSNGILRLESPSERMIILIDGDLETAGTELVLTDRTIVVTQADLEVLIHGEISGTGVTCPPEVPSP